MMQRFTVLLALAVFAATVSAQEKKDDPKTSPAPVNGNGWQRKEVDVVFIGTDCGIGNFAAKEASRKVWDEHFGKISTIRLQISGDDWTAPKAALWAYKAKVVAMMLGGRPVLLEHKAPEAVAKNIVIALKTVRESQPQAKVVLLGIPLPPTQDLLNRTVGPNKELAKDQVAKTRDLVARLADGEQVYFVDPVPKLQARQKEIDEGLKHCKDVHDVTAIWEAIAEAMDEAVKPLLKKK